MDQEQKITFDQLVADGYDGLVCFTSKNCGPCARLKPILSVICEDELVPLVIVDIHDNLVAARSLGLRGAPSVVLVRPGRAPTNLHTGDATDAALRQKLQLASVI